MTITEAIAIATQQRALIAEAARNGSMTAAQLIACYVLYKQERTEYRIHRLIEAAQCWNATPDTAKKYDGEFAPRKGA